MSTKINNQTIETNKYNQSKFIQKKEVTLEDKVRLLTEIVYLARVFDSSHSKSFPKLNFAISTLKEKDLDIGTVRKICYMIYDNKWPDMTFFTNEALKIVIEKIGEEISKVNFSSLIHIQNIMVKEGKKYIKNMYSKAIYTPENMEQRLNNIKTARALYDIGNIFMMEMEYAQDNNPKYLIESLCGKFSPYLKQIATLQNDEIMELLKKIMKEKIGVKTFMYNFDKKLNNCTSVAELITLIVDEKETSNSFL